MSQTHLYIAVSKSARKPEKDLKKLLTFSIEMEEEERKLKLYKTTRLD